MLGHVLRSSEQSPAQSALCYTVNCCDPELNMLPRRVGRHRINLLSVIRKDLESKNIKLVNYYDVENRRVIASDRKSWKFSKFQTLPTKKNENV